MVQKISRRLHRAGHTVYYAGGAVRDLLCGRSPVDYDIVTDCPMDRLTTLFSEEAAKPAGTAFPVLLVNGVEVAPPRTGFPVDHFPRSDLSRRDFTINSMAVHPETGMLLDFHNGRQDLERRIIRFTGNGDERIDEDPVRMVRGCRFAAAIEGTLHPDTLRAIRRNRQRLSQMPPERLRLEVMKAMPLARPSIFFEALEVTGLLPALFPSLQRCVDLDGGPYHGETVFEHCLLTGDALSPRDPLLRLTGFLHDTGKFDAARKEAGGLTFKGHEAHYQAAVTDLAALRFSHRETAFIEAMIQVHMRPLTHESTPRAVRRLLAFLAEKEIPFQCFMRLRIADKRANRAKSPYTLSEIKTRLKKVEAARAENHHQKFTPACLALNGNDIMALLGQPSGPPIGQALAYLFERVLADPALNTPEALARELSTWAASHTCG